MNITLLYVSRAGTRVDNSNLAVAHVPEGTGHIATDPLLLFAPQHMQTQSMRRRIVL